MIIDKLVLGVTLAAPIGPVSIEMIRRGLKNGFWASFNIRLGGAIGNSICLVAAFFGLRAIQDKYPWVLLILGLLGSVLLLYMGSTSIKKGLSAMALGQLSNLKEKPQSHPLLSSLILGLMLAVLSPVGVVFWLTIFANDVGPDVPLTFYHLMINFQIIIGVLIWGAFLSLCLELGRKGLNPSIMRLITIGSGVILLYFGIKYGYDNSLHLIEWVRS